MFGNSVDPELHPDRRVGNPMLGNMTAAFENLVFGNHRKKRDCHDSRVFTSSMPVPG